MSRSNLPDPPGVCPVTGEPMVITELSNSSGTITMRGQFQLPASSKLDADKQALLESFLRARGMFSTMERELGMSYPTIRARVDEMLESLGLVPYKDAKKDKADSGVSNAILDALEQGTLSPDEAKRKLKEKQ